MKTYLPLLFVLSVFVSNAQTPFERVYTILNTKCQNGSCHSAGSSEALKFDGDMNAVHAALYNTTPQNASSVGKFERIVKGGMPYQSFLLRKIAGTTFDADLAIDSTGTEGVLMKDINNVQLSNKEIEFVRQWIMYGAKKSYGNFEAKPDWNTVSEYYDNPVLPFLNKPEKPAVGTGLQFRMGPVLLPKTGASEQEWLMQQEVNFPYLPEIDRIDGFMNQQSHHFILFQFPDSASAADRGDFGMYQVAITSGQTSFDGTKNLCAAWQDNAEYHLPPNTALFWKQKTFLDMNYHIKNYNATSVLPCDFYFNIYFEPRNANTIEMKSSLINKAFLTIWPGTSTQDYDDPSNNLSMRETRYLWNISSHTHKYGTDYDIYVRDTAGNISDKIYEGFFDYSNNYDKGYYDWEHPSIEYFPDLVPVVFGKKSGVKSGLVARTTWNNTSSSPVFFGFTTADEMQLFYYMYTSEPLSTQTAINDDNQKGIYFQVMPNPMSNNGKLVYTLEKSAKVEASVVDITGKAVAILNPENQEDGVHEINIGGEHNLSAGIYFAKLNVDGIVYTKKFVVTQ